MVKFFISLCFSLISYSLHANEWTITSYDWGEFDRNQASVLIKKGSDASSMQDVTARIAHGNDGGQYIYIEHAFMEDYNACEPQKINNESVAKFNGKAVRVFVWCKKFSDADKYYLQLTPSTVAGKKYVVSEFKNSAKHVYFEYNEIYVTISAKGFSAAWNNAGGNAL
ncbi:MAG: hypothetical protein ACRCYF_12045 [Shewanella sp.]|uniref:hypothetical protein n=2 Tax=Aeromonas veronii TaxID=654 RepID=UPI000280599A|nr:hypothetical protein [Aeromonas veronii]EKB22251.1 hypothetical protein HMPREF1170_02513 [Aeromonas veronii AMC35]MBS4702215.1 hypothetical protein [Aeromonas veronii]